MRRTRIKICCIGSIEEARLAIEHGADAIGLVGPMPSGAGVIGDDLIAEIARAVPPPVAAFLLTSETTPEAIIAHARRCGTDTVQMVDHVAPGHVPALRAGLPGVRLVQVIHVEGAESVLAARRIAPLVDAILLDSGRPSATVRELGGTGRIHDWSISRDIVRGCDCPVFLAGGLHAGNVAAAITAVRPFGVDLCTGIRTDDKLDRAKLRAFIAAVAKADDERPHRRASAPASGGLRG